MINSAASQPPKGPKATTIGGQAEYTAIPTMNDPTNVPNLTHLLSK